MIQQTKKLRLDELKVESFITSINEGLQTRAIVGASGNAQIDCECENNSSGSGTTSRIAP